MAAAATDKAWGLWFTGSVDQKAGWCEFVGFSVRTPVTYQTAMHERRWREKIYPNATFEVREVSPEKETPRPEGTMTLGSTTISTVPHKPGRSTARELPTLINGNLLTNQASLAKLLFFSDPAIRGIAARVTDFADAGSIRFEAALERAWTLGQTAALLKKPQDHETVREEVSYRRAVARAEAIFALLTAPQS